MNKIHFYVCICYIMFMDVPILNGSCIEEESSFETELMLDMLAFDIEQQGIFRSDDELLSSWWYRWKEKVMRFLQLRKVGLLCVQSYICARESIIQLWRRLWMVRKKKLVNSE